MWLAQRVCSTDDVPLCGENKPRMQREYDEVVSKKLALEGTKDEGRESQVKRRRPEAVGRSHRCQRRRLALETAWKCPSMPKSRGRGLRCDLYMSFGTPFIVSGFAVQNVDTSFLIDRGWSPFRNPLAQCAVMLHSGCRQHSIHRNLHSALLIR